MSDPVTPPPPNDRAPHFHLLGIPVRAGLGFWITAFFMGYDPKIGRTVVWTLVVFASILLHEMGHALMARRFGASPTITLHAFGGLTSYIADIRMTRGRRALISAAGPLAGLLLGALVLLAAAKFSPGGIPTELRRLASRDASAPMDFLLRIVLFVNIIWSFVNLLPVLPFDGGHILAAALGPRLSLVTTYISVGIALLVAGYAASHRWLLMAVFFGAAAVQGVFQMKGARAIANDARQKLDELLHAAKKALDQGDLELAHALASQVAARARTLPLRNGGFSALAWVFVARGDGQRAREAIAHVDPPAAVDPYTLAAVEDSAGNSARAREILTGARELGFRVAGATKLLIDLAARANDFDAALAIAKEDVELLSPTEARAVVASAIDAGVYRGAANLAAALYVLHEDPEDLLHEAQARLLDDDVESALIAISAACANTTVDRKLVGQDPRFAKLSGNARFAELVGTNA